MAAVVLAAMVLHFVGGLSDSSSSSVAQSLDSSCSSCGTTLTGTVSGSSVDEWREEQIERGRLRIQEGLLIGDACLADEGLPWQSMPATLVYYLVPSLPEEYAPVESFTASVLRDWLAELEDLRVLLILSEEVTEAQRSTTEDYLGAHSVVLLDEGGDLRKALKLEDRAPSIGYLVDINGIVRRRLPPVRPEMCKTILGIVSAYLTSGELPTLSVSFPVPHPAQLTATPQNLVPSLEDTTQPVLVYFFAPGCVGCSLTTELAVQLQQDYDDSICVVGLAYALSYSSVQSAIQFGLNYSSTLDTNRVVWIESLSSEDPIQYEAETVAALDLYTQENGISFPVLVDWDRKLAGSLGLGCAQMPSWALFDSAGTLVNTFPGGRETVYVGGEPVVSAFPSHTYLSEAIDSLVGGSSD